MSELRLTTPIAGSVQGGTPTGYAESRGRTDQSVISVRTLSVIVLIVSFETGAP
ncbi:hypothetical protein [Rhodococcus jostii]|uniref:hypothetical protein n=1 Tax=Rhodococcus jostii TaxID=132919 RepID=UPI00363F7389